jgi:hypothetical protein
MMVDILVTVMLLNTIEVSVTAEVIVVVLEEDSLPESLTRILVMVVVLASRFSIHVVCTGLSS